MQEQQKQQKASGTLGVLNQVVIYESDYVKLDEGVGGSIEVKRY